jgi:antitoxin component of RelBE/YafQ-DinJ toxin-antitoxin module
MAYINHQTTKGGEHMGTQIINARISDERYHELSEYLARTGNTVTNLVRMLLYEKLDKDKKENKK